MCGERCGKRCGEGCSRAYKSMIDIGVKTTSSSMNLIKQVEEGQVQSDSLMTLTSESFSIRKVLFQNYYSATIVGFFISMTVSVTLRPINF